MSEEEYSLRIPLYSIMQDGYFAIGKASIKINTEEILPEYKEKVINKINKILLHCLGEMQTELNNLRSGL